MGLSPKETRRKMQLMRQAQQQGWYLLPSESDELQALCAKANERIVIEHIELAALGSEGLSYTDIYKHNAKGEPTKERAATVKFAKDVGKKLDSDSQGDTHESSED